MTINFPGMSSVHSEVKIPDGVDGSAEGGKVIAANWKKDQAIVTVFPQVYDIEIRKDNATHIVDNIDCRSGSCSVDNLVAEMTINFPGMSSVHSEVKIPDGIDGSANGGKVSSANWKKEQAKLLVFPQFYDVRVRKEQATYIVDNVDCTSGLCNIDDITATLTISFPGLSSMHSNVHLPDNQDNVAGGEVVGKSNWKKNQTEITVLRQTYDVSIKKQNETETAIYDNVDCNSASCDVLYQGNVQVLLIDGNSNSPLIDQPIWAYEKLSDGSLKYSQKATTYTSGDANFLLPGLDDGRVYVLKIKNPFGNGKKYYSAFINTSGPFQFIVTRDGENSLDLTVPEISITSPHNDSSVSATAFEIIGIAEDNREIEAVNLAIVQGSTKLDLQAQYDAISKQWLATIATDTLQADTPIQITVTAEDKAGNQSSSQINVTAVEDNDGPLISISSHSDNSEVPETGFLLSGNVSDLTGVSTLNATLIDPSLGSSINDQAVSFSSQSGNWTLAVTQDLISTNADISITISADDLDGNSSTVSIALRTIPVDNSANHMINRITFGATPQLLDELQNTAAAAYLEQQLNPSQIDDSVLAAKLSGFTPNSKEELQTWTLLHMLYSKRQLLEVMTWFWDNHFNTDIDVMRNMPMEFP